MGIADQLRRAMDAMGGKGGKGGEKGRRKGGGQDRGRSGGGREEMTDRAKDAARDAMDRAKKSRKDQGH
jgi:hypothetical protein